MGFWQNVGHVAAAPLRAIGRLNEEDAKPLNYPSAPSAFSSGYRPTFADQFGQALAGSTARNAPLASGINYQYGGIQRGGELTGQQFGLQRQGLNANYGFDTASLELTKASNRVNQGGLQRLDPILQQRASMADQMRALLDPEFAARTGEVKRSADYASFKNKAESRGRGALGSEGFRMDQGDIRGGAAFQTGELERGYKRDVLRADDARANAYEDVAKNRDALTQLNLQAQQLGIDGQRLASNLHLGLQRLGLDQQMSVNELMQRMNSNRVEYQMLGQKIFQEALSASPQYQSAAYLPPAMQAALAGGRR